MNRHSLTKNITGLIVVIVGVFFLLDSLNVINFTLTLDHYWPVLVILAGLIIFVNNLRSWPTALFVTALGVLFQLRELNIVHVDPWNIVWPLLIVFIGISMLFGKAYTGRRVSKSERDDVSAILSGANVVNHSKAFKQSNATAIMGGAKLDLRNASFEKDALVEVFGFWGGVEIIVPENVVIHNQINNVMAGTEDKTHQSTDKKSPVLTIAGTLIMAGASIRNRPSDD